MSDEVDLRLIFANDVSTHEITVPMSVLVRDLKKSIMEDYWPATLTAIENVDRLRLFAGGRELGGKEAEDVKNLRVAKLAVSQNFPTPVHVQPVLKSAEPAAERETAKPSQCFCAVL
mmetsp:Transcript_73652/g.166920  ORF Transcript_73652/g.166920 Transcript_73652/m.166920 type:complete len:117 (-) Transcript_73652:261-611(-)